MTRAEKGSAGNAMYRILKDVSQDVQCILALMAAIHWICALSRLHIDHFIVAAVCGWQPGLGIRDPPSAGDDDDDDDDLAQWRAAFQIQIVC